MKHKAKEYIDQLTANGRISFTTRKMSEALNMSKKAVTSAVERLQYKGELASPARGYYLIIPPQFRKLGCLPPDYLINDLMLHWDKKYYVGLLSAALYHGAAHQQPQFFQVVTTHARKDIFCGKVHIQFIQKSNLDKTPTKKLKTRTGYMNISTPEATAMDLLLFIRKSGGMNRIATVISELADVISENALIALVEQSKDFAWAQRLGYILSLLGHTKLASALQNYLASKKARIIPLVPYAPMKGVERDMIWRLAINAKIESDLDDTY